MKKKSIIIKSIDLMLQSDPASKDWVKEKPLAVSMYFLVLSSCTLAAFGLFGDAFFHHYLKKSEIGTLSSRIAELAILLVILISLLLAIYNYYRFLIKRGAKVHLSNIFTFYLFTIFAFGLIYSCIYRISPDSFVYPNPPYQVGKTVPDFQGLDRFKLARIVVPP